MLKPLNIFELVKPDVAKMLFKEIMDTNLLQHPYLFEKRKVGYVNQITLKDDLIVSPEDYLCHKDDIVKIEGIECLTPSIRSRLKFIINSFLRNYLDTDYNEFCVNYSIAEFNAHLFMHVANTDSFPLHVDPAHVLCVTLTGSKDFIYIDQNGVEYKTTMEPGHAVFIPANYWHQGINAEDSNMISIGFEPYFIEQMKDYQ